jgi:hypothetical protein
MDLVTRRTLSVFAGLIAGAGVYYFVIADLPELTYACEEFALRPRAYLLGLPVFLIFGLAAAILSRVGAAAAIISTTLGLIVSGYVVSMVTPNLIYQARECGQIK